MAELSAKEKARIGRQAQEIVTPVANVLDEKITVIKNDVAILQSHAVFLFVSALRAYVEQ